VIKFKVSIVLLIVALFCAAFIIDAGDPEPITPTMPVIVVTATPAPSLTPDVIPAATNEPVWIGPTPTSPTDDPAFWWTPTPEAYP